MLGAGPSFVDRRSVPMRCMQVAAASLLFTVLALTAASRAAAAAATNDNVANATVVSALPFTDTADTTEATVESNEGGCGPPTHTVWYRINLPQAATAVVYVTAVGFSNPSVTLWPGSPPNVAPICGGPDGSLTSSLSAGVNYYLQVGTRFFWEPGGQVTVAISALVPPVNDDFADATPFAAVPFRDGGTLAGATVEPSEPQASPYYHATASVWYAFTPSTAATIAVGGSGIAVGAFSGSRVEQLTQLGFQELAYGVPLTVWVAAGATVYLQVVPQFGGSGGPFTLTVDLAPPPVASFSLSPPDPSVFDTVQFVDQSNDPAQMEIVSRSWTFGDGDTAAGCCPTHRFALDGDYDVRLTVETSDGRTATASQSVHVQTHDVSIRELSVPGTGKVGKTAAVVVGLTNARYPEQVDVELLRAVAGGFESVGYVTVFVPARKPRQPTEVKFSYTFRPDDAAVGKVTFEAVATIAGSRDALQGDNTAIATTTKVTS